MLLATNLEAMMSILAQPMMDLDRLLTAIEEIYKLLFLKKCKINSVKSKKSKLYIKNKKK